MRLWSVILVFSVICFCPAMAESAQQEVWYDASGEIVKRGKKDRNESWPEGVSPDWEPAWIIRERNLALKSKKGTIRKGVQFRQSYPSWSLFRYGFWNGMRYAAYERCLVFPGKKIPGRALRLTGKDFYR